MARAETTAAEPAARAEGRLGRPSPSRIAAIDPIIREAALGLFLEHGFEGVTMDMIAQRAQVSKRTLYKRHPSKLELLRVVVDDEVGRWIDGAPELYRALPHDLAGRLRGHARIIVESQTWTDLRRLSRSLTTVGAAHPDILRSMYEAGLQRAMGYLADDLRTTAAAAGGPPADWDFLAEMFFHAIFGWHGIASMLGAADDDQAAAYTGKVVGAILVAAGQPSGPSLAGAS